MKFTTFTTSLVLCHLCMSTPLIFSPPSEQSSSTSTSTSSTISSSSTIESSTTTSIYSTPQEEYTPTPYSTPTDDYYTPTPYSTPSDDDYYTPTPYSTPSDADYTPDALPEPTDTPIFILPPDDQPTPTEWTPNPEITVAPIPCSASSDIFCVVTESDLQPTFYTVITVTSGEPLPSLTGPPGMFTTIKPDDPLLSSTGNILSGTNGPDWDLVPRTVGVTWRFGLGDDIGLCPDQTTTVILPDPTGLYIAGHCAQMGVTGIPHGTGPLTKTAVVIVKRDADVQKAGDYTGTSISTNVPARTTEEVKPTSASDEKKEGVNDGNDNSGFATITKKPDEDITARPTSPGPEPNFGGLKVDVETHTKIINGVTTKVVVPVIGFGDVIESPKTLITVINGQKTTVIQPEITHIAQAQVTNPPSPQQTTLSTIKAGNPSPVQYTTIAEINDSTTKYYTIPISTPTSRSSPDTTEEQVIYTTFAQVSGSTTNYYTIPISTYLPKSTSTSLPRPVYTGSASTYTFSFVNAFIGVILCFLMI